MTSANQRIEEFKTTYADLVAAATAGLDAANVTVKEGFHGHRFQEIIPEETPGASIVMQMSDAIITPESLKKTGYLLVRTDNTTPDIADAKWREITHDPIGVLNHLRTKLVMQGDTACEAGNRDKAETIAQGVAALESIIEGWANNDYYRNLVASLRDGPVPTPFRGQDDIREGQTVVADIRNNRAKDGFAEMVANARKQHTVAGKS
jgi:hypothetical protein